MCYRNYPSYNHVNLPIFIWKTCPILILSLVATMVTVRVSLIHKNTELIDIGVVVVPEVSRSGVAGISKQRLTLVFFSFFFTNPIYFIKYLNIK